MLFPVDTVLANCSAEIIPDVQYDVICKIPMANISSVNHNCCYTIFTPISSLTAPHTSQALLCCFHCYAPTKHMLTLNCFINSSQ